MPRPESNKKIGHHLPRQSNPIFGCNVGPVQPTSTKVWKEQLLKDSISTRAAAGKNPGVGEGGHESSAVAISVADGAMQSCCPPEFPLCVPAFPPEWKAHIPQARTLLQAANTLNFASIDCHLCLVTLGSGCGRRWIFQPC
jgi:hypothetical protein